MKDYRRYYSGSILGWLVLAAVLVFAVGCEPDEGYSDYGGAERKAAAAPDAELLDAVTAAAVERVCSGDFTGAKGVLSAEPTTPGAASVRLLLDRYEQLEEHRGRERQDAYDEQIAELRKVEAKAADLETLDPNTINEAMAAVLLAREYSDESQKDELLGDPFLQRVIQEMKDRGQADWESGDWVDAYANCYYWLTSLFEDNQEYKDKAERLMDLASVEISLKKSGCGENAEERYEDIKPEMFLRALNALEANYVNGIEFRPMAEKALLRCELLGEVMLKGDAPKDDSKAVVINDEVVDKPSSELAWKADPEAVQKWQAGIQAMADEIESLGIQPMTYEQLVRLFDEMLALNAVSLKLPQEVVVAHFSEASLSALDPFTTLVWPWNVRDFEKSMTQQFTGIGIEISKRTGVLKVISLLPDTPAYKSGLDADDEIMAVNGESTAEMSIFCAVSKITGPKGTKVTLTIRRPVTGETWDVTIERDRIVVQPLRGWQRTEDGKWDYMIDPVNGVGYVRLTAFTETSGPDLDRTLTDLEREGLKALILDLRFNSGGYLTSAAEVVDLFVSEGVIVKSNPRHGLATYEIARRSGTHPNYPLVILINSASASASEIVAGALQDSQHQRAILVGERSYGKGSVQVVTPFTGGGSQLKYTIAYYHLPSDQQVKNRYQMERLGRKDWGIAPDIDVKMYSNELRSMLDLQRDNDVLFRADHEEDGEKPTRHSLQKTLQSDPQLAVALIVAQAELITEGKPVALEPSAGSDAVLVQDDSKGQ